MNREILTCKCSRKFNKYGIDKRGNERTYVRCMTCTIENFDRVRRMYDKDYEKKKINQEFGYMSVCYN